ncbi:hypothetical protein P5673_025684 [Acropora cervicornis]|uniref:Uncharacterized protein n=1 Tax=Acropora cervicornis TaxID=6130 RepID=A0AAD9Q1K8_ACRCE|nr:hypothetical protein P5673_025684 [Acropora cervicornis]
MPCAFVILTQLRMSCYNIGPQNRFRCKRVPKPEQCRDTILETAHKEQIQACQYIIDCRHEPLCSLKTATFNITELGNLLNRAIPTNKKVIDLLKVKSNPEQIFAVLLRVFGDGDSLPQLQQQFFSYRQKEGEDLVSCSLHLLQLFDRIVQLDSSFKPGRDAQLKSRLAEAVREKNLRTELRRLNSEHPELTYFDVRDRVMKLMSKPPVKQSTLVQETATAGLDIHSILRQQSQQISAQQKQIESLVSALSSRDVSSRGGGQRRCWAGGPICSDGDPGGEFKLIGPTAASHAVGEYSTYGGSIIENAVGNCPEVKIKLGGVDVGCLIDTGAEVSTIPESFYKEFLVQGREVIDVTSYIKTSASQGLEIPYVGYVELQLTALSHTFNGLGFLIVKDPVSTPIQLRKERVPGVLGSNVLRDMRKCLVSRYGEDFAESSPRKLARSGEGVLLHALQMYRSLVMSQETAAQIGNDEGKVRLVGSGPILVPARSIRVLQGSVKPAGAFPYDVLIERIEATCNLAELPYGVTVGAAVVTVDSKGRVPIQLANFSSRDVYPHPRTPAAAISTFHMEPALEFVRVDESHGRSKIQDVWDATPYKVVRRLDTGNTYVVVPLVATTAEEELKKTVHRNDILHAKQRVRDIAFDGDDMGQGSGNAGGSAVGDEVPLDTEASSSDEDDVVEAVPHESPSEVDVQVTHGTGNHTQNQVEVPEEDAPDLDHVDEPPVSDCAVNEGAAPKAQADSELSTDGADPEFSTDGEDPELSTGAADPEKAEAQRASTSGGAAAEVTAASDTNNHPPVRLSTRVGAGQHSNPHHLPRPAMGESVEAAVVDSQVLNCVAQSNLLLMQLLAKNAQR